MRILEREIESHSEACILESDGSHIARLEEGTTLPLW